MYQGTVDFNPTAVIDNHTSSGSTDLYLLRFSIGGGFEWAHTCGGTGADKLLNISVDADNNVVLVGSFSNTVDFDFSSVVSNQTSMGGYDGFFAKYDSTGNFIWCRAISGAGNQYSDEASVDPYGNIYLSGHFEGSVDFDFSAGSAILTAGFQDLYIAKYDTYGNYFWANSLYSSGSTLINGLYQSNNKIMIAGIFQSTTDFDPSGSVMNFTSAGSTDGYWATYTEQLCSATVLIIDTVSNVTCSSLGYADAHGYGPYPPYNYQWNTSPLINDSVATFNTGGLYTLTLTDNLGCIIQHKALLNGPSSMTNFELSGNLVAGQFRPGFTTNCIIDVMNSGCVPSAGSLVLISDSLLSWYGISPLPDTIIGDSLIWFFDTLSLELPHFISHLHFTTSPTANYMDTIYLSTIVTPFSGDADTLNNLRHYSFPVVGSYDPNIKQVYPQGINMNHGILNNQKMTYTVQFQNTGTADAINIYVLDTLDPNLDLNTVNVIGSSHYMFTEVLPGNVLKFHFPNINLPDSTSDEPNSHGYVIYEVDQLPNLPHNTVIENTAAIYFDYNTPVITNTVLNTIDLGAQIITSINNSCPGDPAMLTVVPNIPGLQANWQWFEGTCSGTYLGHGNNIVVTPSLTTSYFVKDSLGVMCFSTTINTLPVYDVTQNSTICSNDSLFFGAGYVHDPGSYVYTFPSESGCDSTVTLTLSHYLNDSLDYVAAICTGDSIYFGSQYYHFPGSYLHTFTNSFGCDSTVTLILTNTSVNTTVNETDPTLAASATPATYQWVDCNAGFAPLAGQTNQSYTATGNGNYAVIITQNGCTDTSACYSIISTGIVGSLDENVMVYPNPVNNELNIVFNNSTSPAHITLTDMTGQIILHQTSNSQTVKLQTNYLKNGIYCLTISSLKETMVTKIIKL